MRRYVILPVLAFTIAVSALSHPRDRDYGVAMSGAYDRLFNDMSLVNQGRLGISRVSMPQNGHMGIGTPGNDRTQNELSDLRKQLSAKGFTSEEGFLTNVAWKKKNGSQVAYWARFVGYGEALFPDYNRSQVTVPEALAEFSDKVFHSAKEHPYRMNLRGYSIYAAPIRYEHKECLSCHQDSKIGQVAAVFVSAIKKGN